MAKLSAVEVVDKMLEEFSGEAPAPTAGGAGDPWRQGGLKKMHFTAKDFLTKDPNRKVPHPAVRKVPAPTKHVGRFKWTPEEHK